MSMAKIVQLVPKENLELLASVARRAAKEALATGDQPEIKDYPEWLALPDNPDPLGAMELLVQSGQPVHRASTAHRALLGLPAVPRSSR